MVFTAGFAPALATLSTSCLCCWTTRANKVDPPDGDGRAETLAKVEAFPGELEVDSAWGDQGGQIRGMVSRLLRR